MNAQLQEKPRAISAVELDQTRAAFDSVAADYDGPRGNNALIQRMRVTMWRELERRFARDARLIDLGCGTGLDAMHLAQSGRSVLATDWSPGMVERTVARAAQAGLAARIDARRVGAHQLEQVDTAGGFDGAYSNFGPLNCVPDLGALSTQCARLLRPGGKLVFSVIGRICPWEYLYYRWRRPERAKIRALRGPVAVAMNHQTIWTRYFTPREFYADFARRFDLIEYRALSLFMPPPYLVRWYERNPRLLELLGLIDDAAGGWPVLRNAGDHFLIVMRRKDALRP
ncbi:MAG TPA: class I SAM-dependent methyltransferase [Steroidobacteraceae bacterium]|nr:class I SAM-dependent methyltransferase [Steroidobacteraceae bacterium]